MEVEEGVEEDASQGPMPFQVSQREGALLLRRQHVMHLAQDVLEQDGLLIQALHAVQLLLVEELHTRSANQTKASIGRFN